VVASVLPYPPLGGAEKRTLRLLEAMIRAGALPTLVVTSTPDPEAAAALGERGVKVEVAAEPRPGPLRRLEQHVARRPSPYVPRLARLVGDWVTARRPAFVQFEHTQNAYYLRRARGAPTVLSLHNVDSEMVATLAGAARPGSVERLRLRNRAHAMRTTERRAARAADLVVCVSGEDLAALGEVGGEGIVVPNGVDDALFAIDPEPPGAETVLFFGRYDYEPNALGISRFLREGWAAVAARRPDARLRLVGPGIDPELAALAAATERVDLAGPVERIETAIAGAAVVAVPIWQGGGTRLKVLEALAAARPVAGTPLGVSGIGFVDGEHGLVASEPAGLGEAIAKLLADRELAARLAVGGRGLADRFRWRLATEPLERRYRGWVDGEGS